AHRRDRRLPRAPGAREGNPARLRRPATRRLDRLPDLPVPAVTAGVAGRAAADRDRGRSVSAAVRRRLRRLPAEREGGRRLFRGLPVVLEPGGVLPLRAAWDARVAGAGRRGGAGGADVRAVAISVPQPEGTAEPADERPGGAVGGPGGAGGVAVAD